jgi:hypothetical protein
MFVSVISVQVQKTETNRKHETIEKQIEFQFLSVGTEKFMYCFDSRIS